MLYSIIAVIFIVLAIVSYRYNVHFIQPITCILYALTSLIMFAFHSGNWVLVFMMRYFLYIIGALLVVIVPFILLTLAFLMLSAELKYRSAWFKRIIIWLMSILIVAFASYSFWNVFRIKELQITVIFGLYSSIAIFLIALFISYLFLCRLLNAVYKIDGAQLLLVLGTDIYEEGRIQSDLEKRLQKLVAYYTQLSDIQQQNTYIIVSGGNPTDDGQTEADAMFHYLVAQGIAKEKIIKEPSARNTRENVQFSKPFINNIGKNRRLVVISSSYHLPRIAYFLQKYDVKAKLKGARTSLIFLPFAVVREFLALLLLTKEISLIYIIYIMITELLKII